MPGKGATHFGIQPLPLGADLGQLGIQHRGHLSRPAFPARMRATLGVACIDLRGAAAMRRQLSKALANGRFAFKKRPDFLVLNEILRLTGSDQLIELASFQWTRPLAFLRMSSANRIAAATA